MNVAQNADGIVGLVLLFAILIMGLKMILGNAFKFIFPVILLGAYVQAFPGDKLGHTLFNLCVHFAGPFIILGILYSVFFGGSKHNGNCNCNSCRKGN